MSASTLDLPALETARHSAAQFAPTSNGRPSKLRQTATGAWSKVFEQLNEIAGLENDWDGEGAPAPRRDIVDCAIALVDHMRSEGAAPPVRAVPSRSGTVILEWNIDSIYWEVDIIAPDRAESLLIVPGQEPQHEMIWWESPSFSSGFVAA